MDERTQERRATHPRTPGQNGNHGRTLPATAAGAVSDYGIAPSNWSGSGNSSSFGVCLQDVSPATVVDVGWTKDTTGGPTCTATDTDPWRSIPATGTKIAHVISAGQTGRVDLVWGVRTRADQAKGTYFATMVFEVVAPWV